jgi:hypothetical protein
MTADLDAKHFHDEDAAREFLGKHRKIRLLALASGRILRSGGTEGRGDAAAG